MGRMEEQRGATRDSLDVALALSVAAPAPAPAPSSAPCPSLPLLSFPFPFPSLPCLPPPPLARGIGGVAGLAALCWLAGASAFLASFVTIYVLWPRLSFAI